MRYLKLFEEAIPIDKLEELSDYLQKISGNKR